MKKAPARVGGGLVGSARALLLELVEVGLQRLDLVVGDGAAAHRLDLLQAHALELVVGLVGRPARQVLVERGLAFGLGGDVDDRGVLRRQGGGVVAMEPVAGGVVTGGTVVSAGGVVVMVSAGGAVVSTATGSSAGLPQAAMVRATAETAPRVVRVRTFMNRPLHKLSVASREPFTLS